MFFDQWNFDFEDPTLGGAQKGFAELSRLEFPFSSTRFVRLLALVQSRVFRMFQDLREHLQSHAPSEDDKGFPNTPESLKSVRSSL